MKRHRIREHLEAALEQINDPKGEGARTFLNVYADQSRQMADAADDRLNRGMEQGPLDGKIVAIKDLFDVSGQITTAGSKLLQPEKPAAHDAQVVARLKVAGAVLVGRTNMSEFAFSAVGVNPHYGTPGNPADPSRIPGGSTSGGAVAVATNMSDIALGSDTGGSVRIPAGLCGIVGFKPTQHRIPRTGAFPLSYTLDTIGPLARNVSDCLAADAVLAGEKPEIKKPSTLVGLRLAIATNLPGAVLEPNVAHAFRNAIDRIRAAGASIVEVRLQALDELREFNTHAPATFAAIESFAIHQAWLQKGSEAYDPLILNRIEQGRGVSAADYIRMVKDRQRISAIMQNELGPIDALLVPTTPVVAPFISELADEEAFSKVNLALLSNAAFANFCDLPAISIPLPDNRLPIGLTIIGRTGSDGELQRLALSVEQRLS